MAFILCFIWFILNTISNDFILASRPAFSASGTLRGWRVVPEVLTSPAATETTAPSPKPKTTTTSAPASNFFYWYILFAPFQLSFYSLNRSSINSIFLPVRAVRIQLFFPVSYIIQLSGISLSTRFTKLSFNRTKSSFSLLGLKIK